VNVNVAAVGIRVLSFQAAQPENAADDRIAAGRVRDENFASRPAIFEDSSDDCSAADFFCNLQLAQWRATTSWRVANRELRCGNRIRRDERAIVEQGQALLGNTDHNSMARVRRDTRRNEKRYSREVEKFTSHRSNRKNFSAVSVVASAISSTEIPRAWAIASATSRVCA